MTFKTWITDQSGKPVEGAYVQAAVQTSGAVFARTTDGGGYADVAMGATPHKQPVTLVVLANGYQMATRYLNTETADQEVRLPLAPFVG